MFLREAQIKTAEQEKQNVCRLLAVVSSITDHSHLTKYMATLDQIIDGDLEAKGDANVAAHSMQKLGKLSGLFSTG